MQPKYVSYPKRASGAPLTQLQAEYTLCRPLVHSDQPSIQAAPDEMSVQVEPAFHLRKSLPAINSHAQSDACDLLRRHMSASLGLQG